MKDSEISVNMPLNTFKLLNINNNNLIELKCDFKNILKIENDNVYINKNDIIQFIIKHKIIYNAKNYNYVFEE